MLLSTCTGCSVQGKAGAGVSVGWLGTVYYIIAIHTYNQYASVQFKCSDWTDTDVLPSPLSWQSYWYKHRPPQTQQTA